jgi:hypothetical protein
MISATSNAILAHSGLDREMCMPWDSKGGAEAPSDLSATTNTGRVADLIALAIDNSGASRFYIVSFRPASTGMVGLLRRWIDEYGDEEDPDLDLQLAELRRNRLALREQC